MNWPPAYQIRKSKRARHLQLQITPEKGLEVVIPYRLRHYSLDLLFTQHRDWIEQALNKRPPVPVNTDKPESLELLALNERWQISYQMRAHPVRVRERPGYHLVVSGGVDTFSAVQRALKAWMVRYAKAQLLPKLHALSLESGLAYQMASVRTQKTRWGSCNAKAQISLNAHLLFLPPQLVRHILLHELCHLRHLNHSVAFWRLLAQLDCDYQRNKALCREAQQFIPGWLHQQSLAMG